MALFLYMPFGVRRDRVHLPEKDTRRAYHGRSESADFRHVLAINSWTQKMQSGISREAACRSHPRKGSDARFE
jgi:hypothetical protein